MPEKRRRNRFEEHINSEAFDVSQLENLAPLLADEERNLLEYLAELPQPLDHDLWDTHLDERQRFLCAYLSTELMENVIKAQYPDLVADLNDEDLFQLISLPVMVAMLVEENLHQPPAPEPEPPPPPEPVAETFVERLGYWWSKTRLKLLTLVERWRNPKW